MTMQKMGFGYQADDDENLKSKQGGRFGLNQNARLTKFEYNPNAGKGGAEANAIDITVQVMDREFMVRHYEVTKVFDKENNEITDETSEEYIKGYNEQWIQINAVFTHILKCFRTAEEIKTALEVPLNNFADYARVLEGLLPPNFQNVPLDVFLQYQWNIKEGQDKTYLELPKNMKGGYFICPTMPGTWKESFSEGNLRYVDEAGNKHKFERSENFMGSPKATQQVEGQDDSSAIESAPASAGTPTSSTW